MIKVISILLISNLLLFSNDFNFISQEIEIINPTTNQKNPNNTNTITTNDYIKKNPYLIKEFDVNHVNRGLEYRGNSYNDLEKYKKEHEKEEKEKLLKEKIQSFDKILKEKTIKTKIDKINFNKETNFDNFYKYSKLNNEDINFKIPEIKNERESRNYYEKIEYFKIFGNTEKLINNSILNNEENKKEIKEKKLTEFMEFCNEIFNKDFYLFSEDKKNLFKCINDKNFEKNKKIYYGDINIIMSFLTENRLDYNDTYFLFLNNDNLKKYERYLPKEINYKVIKDSTITEEIYFYKFGFITRNEYYSYFNNEKNYENINNLLKKIISEN